MGTDKQVDIFALHIETLGHISVCELPFVYIYSIANTGPFPNKFMKTATVSNIHKQRSEHIA